MLWLLRKRLWRFLKKIKRELSYDPTILLLDIYPKELKTGSQKGVGTPMFTATLFIIVKRQKQPNYPSTDEWVNKMLYTCSGTLLSLKKERNSDMLQHG